jgi:hypothetical protein
MTLALVVGIVFALLCLLSWADKKKREQDWKRTNRGSRIVEQQQREKWSRQLFDEYCSLIDRLLIYPGLEQTKYWRDFTGADYQDKAALEILRARHGLPSDEELKGTVYDRSFGKETNYGSLQKIIWFCVFRSVTHAGYRLNGIDLEEIRKLRLKNKKVHKEYPWFSDDYHKKK